MILLQSFPYVCLFPSCEFRHLFFQKKKALLYINYSGFKEAYHSVRREVHSILTEFDIPTQLVGLIKMCLNETYGKDPVGKHLSHTFPIQNCLINGEALTPLPFNSASEYSITKGLENCGKNTECALKLSTAKKRPCSHQKNESSLVTSTYL
jgi:hypothetical protein